MLQHRSFDSVEIISIDRAEALDALRRAARRIRAQHPEVVDVRVFGSLARGDQVGTSDVDVLIVLDDDESGDPIEQIRRFYPYFDLPVGVDLLVMTRGRWTRRQQAGDAFAERIGRESVSLTDGAD
jgi:predicted nucleotidyltransferase